MFRDAGLWDDAQRVARHYRPDVVPELQRLCRAAAAAGAGAGAAADAKIQSAQLFERQARAPVAAVISVCVRSRR